MWLILLVIVCLRVVADDGGTSGTIPKSVLEVCQRKESNRATADKALTDDVNQSCRDQIKTSLDLCLADPGITRADYDGTLSAVDNATTDMRTAVQRQISAYSTGQQKFITAKGICDTERANVEHACAGAIDQLKGQQQTAARDGAEARSALTSGPAAARPANRARVQSSDSAGKQTQAQLNATVNARTRAQTAINDMAQCHQFQGDIYAEAITNAQTQMTKVVSAPQDSNQARSSLIQTASLSSVNPGDGISSNTLNGNDATVARPTAWSALPSKETAWAAADGAVGVAGGKVFTPVNLVSDAAGGNYFASTVDAAGVGKMVFTNSSLLGVVGGLPGTVLVMTLDPKSTAPCDQNLSNPVDAKRAGCSPTLHLPTSSANQAMATLNSP